MQVQIWITFAVPTMEAGNNFGVDVQVRDNENKLAINFSFKDSFLKKIVGARKALPFFRTKPSR